MNKKNFVVSENEVIKMKLYCQKIWYDILLFVEVFEILIVIMNIVLKSYSY